MNHVIGLDIGGANLKAAHSDGPCRAREFPLWKQPEQLGAVLLDLIADWIPCRALAITMTGELADCFETKADGVDHILNAVETIADRTGIIVWQTAGEFVPTDVAREYWSLTAASNWHALATFVGRAVPQGRALLIDVGSTTTDIIPLENGFPIAEGLTDGERLASGELVYCGVRRTPLCALANELTFRGRQVRLAAEFFATTADVYWLLGDLPEEPHGNDTANGRPGTQEAAHDRLVRMLCCDRTEVSRDEAIDLARQLASIQLARITAAIDQVLSRQSKGIETVVVSGSGSFLAERAIAQHTRLKTTQRLSLERIYSPEVAESACAVAVARLGAELW